METVLARSKSGKIYASHTYWTDNITKEKQHAFFLRIYHVQQDGPEEPVVIGNKHGEHNTGLKPSYPLYDSAVTF